MRVKKRLPQIESVDLSTLADKLLTLGEDTVDPAGWQTVEQAVASAEERLRGHADTN